MIIRINVRAHTIYKEVLEAMQQADEIEGVEGEDYIRLMQAISDEALGRLITCKQNMEVTS
jgi:hypothetical protein